MKTRVPSAVTMTRRGGGRRRGMKHKRSHERTAESQVQGSGRRTEGYCDGDQGVLPDRDAFEFFGREDTGLAPGFAVILKRVRHGKRSLRPG